MRPVRRELLNGLFVLVLASLIHAAFEAFHLKLDVHLWALIVMGIAIAVSGYVIFEIALGFIASTEDREKEWLKQVGTPARLQLNLGAEDVGAGAVAFVEAMKAMSPGSDLTVVYYFDSDGGKETAVWKKARDTVFSSILELLKRGTIREYKRIVCFDHDVLANDHELKSGLLRVGEGPGTIGRVMGDHCRRMMERQRCPSDFERALYNAASPRIESFQKQRNMAPAKAEEAESFIRSDGNEQEHLFVRGFELTAKSAFDRF
jgi:hypothetical protein